MKSRRIGIAAATLALMTAGSVGSAQVAQSSKTTQTQLNEIRSTPPETKRTRQSIRSDIGGVPLLTYAPDYGMSPKEYGIRYGHGNSKHKTNFKRLSHNAKLKRRKSA